MRCDKCGLSIRGQDPEDEHEYEEGADLHILEDDLGGHDWQFCGQCWTMARLAMLDAIFPERTEAHLEARHGCHDGLTQIKELPTASLDVDGK